MVGINNLYGSSIFNMLHLPLILNKVLRRTLFSGI